MSNLLKAIFGKGNRVTTAAGFGALCVAVGRYLQTGEVDSEACGLAFAGIVGLFSRGGGTGSDAPKKVLVLLLACVPLVSGCAIMGGQPDSLQPILSRTIFDADGKPIGEVKVSLGTELTSRGCIGLTVSQDGQVAFVAQQDGSSDWSTVRGIVSIAPETVAVVMNPISTPIEALVQALSGRPPMEKPQPLYGCTGIRLPYQEPAKGETG